MPAYQSITASTLCFFIRWNRSRLLRLALNCPYCLPGKLGLSIPGCLLAQVASFLYISCTVSLPSVMWLTFPGQMHHTYIQSPQKGKPQQSNECTSVQYGEPVNLYWVYLEGIGMTKKQLHHRKAHPNTSNDSSELQPKLSTRLAGNWTGWESLLSAVLTCRGQSFLHSSCLLIFILLCDLLFTSWLSGSSLPPGGNVLVLGKLSYNAQYQAGAHTGS